MVRQIPYLEPNSVSSDLSEDAVDEIRHFQCVCDFVINGLGFLGVLALDYVAFSITDQTSRIIAVIPAAAITGVLSFRVYNLANHYFPPHEAQPSDEGV